MRIRGLAHRFFIFAILGVVSAGGGCSGSSNAPAAHDGAVDIATSDRPTTDTPIDNATTDGALDAGDAAPGTTTQKLALTIIVTDQIGGDGGLEVGPFDAAAIEVGDGGLDGDASDAPATITVDPDLVNPWGLAFNPTGPLWVADNGTGVSTVYSATGQPVPLVVNVPVADGGTPPSAPTGLVFNATATTFMGDKFIFSTANGTISGWQTGTAATLRVDNSPTSTVYKGLALTTVNNVARLYATDFHNAKIDVFDQTYAKVTPTGGFTDANIPTGFAPFGIQAVGAVVWVTYAKQDATKTVDVAGAGNGYVDVFDFDGNLTRRAISQGALDAPWGIAIAPADFGAFSNALLVGNFGDGHINAYNAATGTLLGAALDLNGVPLAIDGLWSLVFGNDTNGAPHNRLFFTAGPKMETHGLLGHLDLP
jgi:uncharacterized protein (TIGR03118 family)